MTMSILLYMVMMMHRRLCRTQIDTQKNESWTTCTSKSFLFLFVVLQAFENEMQPLE